jgi:hypothetical protein
MFLKYQPGYQKKRLNPAKQRAYPYINILQRRQKITTVNFCNLNQFGKKPLRIIYLYSNLPGYLIFFHPLRTTAQTTEGSQASPRLIRKRPQRRIASLNQVHRKVLLIQI